MVQTAILMLQLRGRRLRRPLRIAPRTPSHAQVLPARFEGMFQRIREQGKDVEYQLLV